MDIAKRKFDLGHYWDLKGLRLYLDIESVFCCLLQRMARMDMESKLENLAMPSKITKKLLWLEFADEICLISFLELYRSILYLVKDTK